METEVACLENVWLQYDSVVALENVNLCLKPLDFVSVIGPNGGGKTSLLKLMLGLVRPSR